MADEPAKADKKGKGKALAMLGSLVNDTLDGLTKDQIESQIKEFEELRSDLNAKVCLLLLCSTSAAECHPRL